MGTKIVNHRWSGRSILVTGATGIVGSWLCEELLRRGSQVTALVLDDEPSSRFFSEALAEQCSIIRGDLADFATCMRAINTHDVEIIFHLGAQTIVGSALRDPLECFESNIRGTYNLLEAARRLPGLASRIVVASSDKAYGESPVLPYTENMPLHGTHPYDVSKSCTDLLAHTYANTYDLSIAIARCGNIYGGGDLNWSRIVPGTIRSILQGQRPVLRSDGKMIRDYIYVRDVVSAYITLADHLDRSEVQGEAFNFSPESNISVLEIVDTIRRLMGSDLEPDIQATAHHEIPKQTLDATKARNILQWRCEWSLESGLAETVPWYRDRLDATVQG